MRSYEGDCILSSDGMQNRTGKIAITPQQQRGLQHISTLKLCQIQHTIHCS